MSEPPSGFGTDEISLLLKRQAEPFDSWWARNHPWDWWSKERGTPLRHRDRLLVAQLARDAYERKERQ